MRQAWIDLSVISITKAIIRYYGEEDSGGGLILVCDEEERRAGQRTLSRFAVVNTEGNVVQGYEQSCLDAARGNSHKKRSHTFTAMFLFVCHATCVFENVSLSMKSLSWWNLNCVARLSDFEHIILRFKFDDRHKKYEMK